MALPSPGPSPGTGESGLSKKEKGFLTKSYRDFEEALRINEMYRGGEVIGSRRKNEMIAAAVNRRIDDAGAPSAKMRRDWLAIRREGLDATVGYLAPAHRNSTPLL